MTSSRLLVDATDIAAWADRLPAQDKLPQLLRRLVLATGDGLESVGFREGEGVQIGGWDGLVRSSTASAFLPAGISGWEMGCGKDPAGKANSDYESRSRDPGVVDSSSTTFVFVTPRRWANKQKWVQEKRKDSIWNDVRAYDADDLATWLEQAPAVHVWLSSLVGKQPQGVEDLFAFWDTWSNVTSPPFSEDLMVAGRADEVAHVQHWLEGAPSAFAVHGETEDEAIAFLAAVIASLPPFQRELQLSRTIVVRDESVWEQMAATKSKSLLLISAFADRTRVTAAVSAGHHVLIPLDRAEPPVGERVEIPRPRRQVAAPALKAMGLSDERSEHLAVIGRASLEALRRALAHPAALIPEWAQAHAGAAILPAIFAGRWDDRNENDQKIIAALARCTYSDYRDRLLRLSREPDPPIRLIDSVWMIVAKADAWALLARFISEDDLNRFEAAVLEACGELDPKFELVPEERWLAVLWGKALRHSTYLREGLADTLALMASCSQVFSLKTVHKGQEWSSRVVRELLDRATSWQFWASLGGQMRLLAEAAPDAFLDAVERGLTGSEPLLGRLFEHGNPLFTRSPHTELLWALETVAWAPEYLGRATFILAKLARIDPGGQTVNRPSRSLQQLFLPWRPRTTATASRRLRVLETLRKREPEVAWKMLAELVGQTTGVSTARPTYRDWAPDEGPRVARSEMAKTYQ